jgi:hypothetical protein
MMEGTGGIQYLLPAIISIYVGNWVAHHIHHAGAYEADLERLGTFHHAIHPLFTGACYPYSIHRLIVLCSLFWLISFSRHSCIAY